MHFEGKVIPGRGIGKQIGFPTLNFEIPDDFELAEGVYACRVRIPPSPPFVKGGSETKWSGGISQNAVLFFGNRETFDAGKALEVHILDKELAETPESAEVEIGEKIRDVMKFENEEELKKQISHDCETARKLLAVE